MFSSVLVKNGSKLGYADKKDKLLYDLFLDKIEEGEEVEIFICKKGVKASVAQISKVHASIRTIANELGYSFSEMKDIIKERSGLCFQVEDEGRKKILCKSFGDCSKEEITLAIEACNQVATDNNIMLG